MEGKGLLVTVMSILKYITVLDLKFRSTCNCNAFFSSVTSELLFLLVEYENEIIVWGMAIFLSDWIDNLIIFVLLISIRYLQKIVPLSWFCMVPIMNLKSRLFLILVGVSFSGFKPYIFNVFFCSSVARLSTLKFYCHIDCSSY